MNHAHPHPDPDTATDPVCGMPVKTADAPNKADHAGHTYYFCSPRCFAKFTAEPLRYLKPAAAPSSAKLGTIYTCPMHPQIRQVGPGSCPICGMALEPAEAAPEERPKEELLDMTRRLWVGAVLAVPVMAVDMGGHFLGIDALLPHGMKDWVLLVLATPVVLWAGWPFFVRGAQSVARRSLNMFPLIALGTGVPWLYSVVATVAPGLFPAALRGADGSMPGYFEPASIIVVLGLVGQVLELRARDATGGATKAPRGLAPRTDPAPGRHGLGLVRAGGHGRRRAGLHRLDDLGAVSGLRLCPVGGGGGADHRLPLRARAGHADVDHGRRRPRRRRGHPDSQRRGAGAPGEGRYASVRQDRHAHRRPAGRHRDPEPGRPRRGGDPPAGAQPR